ncbi:MAG: peptidoglycan-associated lipoprotein Pal [Acidobacteria bacterium]|jgi:peptidoglycan-associated lipoprotein|nr:peptidoglycan-associated lipoprotein Pal [Acidobacteriota bacterium]
MRSMPILRLFLVLAAVGLMATACSSSRPQAPVETVAQQPVVHPTATPIPEESVTQPTTEPVPSVAVHEELPEDLKELNRRGYLKDVFFDTDSYALKPEARETLATDAAWMSQHPSIKILIEGHCDERNTREYNLALGQRRADATRDYLVFLGVSPDRIQTISYGEERPFALGHNEAAWQLNRRAHFVIVAR